jgi:hypothetical protein
MSVPVTTLPAAAHPYQIFVKPLVGRLLAVEVLPTDTVQDVLDRVLPGEAGRQLGQIFRTAELQCICTVELYIFI